MSAPFLDGYVSDDGEALIAGLESAAQDGKASRETLQFYCEVAARSLRVARDQWQRTEGRADVRELSEQRRNLRGGGVA